MSIWSSAQHDNKLDKDDSQEDAHVDDDQAGNRITCLELVPYIVKDGSQHYRKSMSIVPKTTEPGRLLTPIGLLEESAP